MKEFETYPSWVASVFFAVRAQEWRRLHKDAHASLIRAAEHLFPKNFDQQRESSEYASGKQCAAAAVTRQ
jgi:hypothetical protein